MKKHGVVASLLALVLPAVAVAQPVQWAGNGHWYEFIRTPVTWENAFAAANASSYNGLNGYLATITSAQENTFVASSVANGAVAWVGGSDAAAEGVWTWQNGPENGQAFSYLGWVLAEPNDFQGEDYLQINVHAPGGWNDAGSAAVNGYVIEYSAAVPEPMSAALLALGLGAFGLLARRRHRA